MKDQIIEKLSALITAAFGFTAALAWNSAIQAILAEFFAQKEGIASMLTYAIVVTVIAVIATIWIGKIAEKIKKV